MHANYDEATREPVSEPSRSADAEERPEGHLAPTCGSTQRRPEIVEDFEREVLGRVPKNVPKVTWTVTETATGMVGDRPVVGKQLVGRVDNSALPGHQRRHPDDARDASRREGPGAGDDDVRRRPRHPGRDAAGPGRGGPRRVALPPAAPAGAAAGAAPAPAATGASDPQRRSS